MKPSIFNKKSKTVGNVLTDISGSRASCAIDTKKPRVAENLHNSIQRKEKRIVRRTFSNFLAAFPCLYYSYLNFH